MTRKKWFGVGVVAVVVGVGVTALWAGPAAGPGGGGPLRRLIGGHIGRFMTLRAELGLTDEQREQIRGVVQGHKKEIASAAQQVVQKRRVLRDAVLAQSPDEAAIRKAADELGKSIGDAAVLASKVAGEVRPILTPEQIERIKKFQADSASATDNFLEGVLSQ